MDAAALCAENSTMVEPQVIYNVIAPTEKCNLVRVRRIVINPFLLGEDQLINKPTLVIPLAEWDPLQNVPLHHANRIDCCSAQNYSRSISPKEDARSG